MQENDNLTSRGPWTFETSKTLSQNDTEKFDFRHLKYNKRKRFFKPYLPFDSMQVSNLATSSKIEVTVNGVYDTVILPNSVEGFSEAGITEISVTNPDATDIDAGDIIIEVSKDAYDSDDKARESKNQGPIGALIENTTGIRL